MSKKNKKQKNKNVTSIAIKLNAHFVSSLFIKFLIIDILIIAGFIASWCAENEMNTYGKIVANATRHLQINSINNAKYSVTWANGQTMTKDASTFLNIVIIIIITILIIQTMMILIQIIRGSAKNRKILKPLNEIAEATSRLSNLEFDEQKFQNLEDAIHKINPTTNDERVYIGDSEFGGLEIAINNLLDRMRESYRQQSRFVSDASHELRTPIAVIQGYANMLDRWGKDDPEVLEESITAIKSESENMKNLIEQLLFLARGANGKTSIKSRDFVLNDMIKEVVEESKMIDKDHEYIYIESQTINVYGDISLLKQTARILIENAAKYTEKGEAITLKVGKNEKNEPYFSVQDNGIGIAEEDIPHIFERFFRSDSSRVKKNGGTGLGLSIAKWIIDSHKGYFSVLSRKEIGTRITVYLPIP